MGTKQVVAGTLVAACIVVAVVVPCVLLVPGDDDQANLPPYTFEDRHNAEFDYDSLYPNWDISTDADDDYITMNENRDVIRKFVRSNTVEPILRGDIYDSYNADGYSVSSTGQYIFLRYNYQKVWRHSYVADFVVVNNDGTKIDITDFKSENAIHYMKWSPKGNKLAYVYKWNLYVVDLDGANTAIQVTNDGSENNIYNGIPDWVYEEEQVSTNNLLFWSPDATKIGFVKTNDENTPRIEYSMYKDGQYPETIKIAYPKAGTPIGTATLHVYDLETTKTMNLASPYTSEEHYFARMEWISEDICLPTWTNRLQTDSIAVWCIHENEAFDCSKTGFENHEHNDKGWVGSFNPFDIKPVGVDGDYVTIYARPNEDPEDGFWQLVYVNGTQQMDEYQFMTNTGYDIVSVDHYDSTNDYIYFTGVKDRARDRQLLRLKSSERDVTQPQCMSCQLQEQYSGRCDWVTARFNAQNSLVVLNCRGPEVPLTFRFEIDGEGNWNYDDENRVLYSNDMLTSKIQEVKWPKREFGSFKSVTGYSFNYEIWRPMDFDSTKSYPLLIEVYAGPEFQKIQSIWTESFTQTYMVSSRDMIVASVDGRGSAFQGYKFMREAYKKLGQNEPVDQTEFANYLLNQYKYLDKNNVAIWGWSYGGYTTSHTLGYDGGETFKCGVAVAPLADWRFYDAMYAERYMQKPGDNDEGYTKASIVTAHNLTSFQNSWYTLIHGTADDNVHFQNAAAMEMALVQADVNFDTFFYADQAHSINIGNAKDHVYRQIDFRLSSCLNVIKGHFPDNILNRDQKKSSSSSRFVRSVTKQKARRNVIDLAIDPRVKIINHDSYIN